MEIDIEVVKKAQQGDKRAFDRIISCYSKMVTVLCKRYMRNDEDALEMAQEAFCAAYNAIKRFECKSKVSTWLYRIAVNQCINRLDTLKRRKYFDTDSMNADEETGAPGFDVADTRQDALEKLESKETREMIMEMLSGFEEPERSAVILRDIQGYEYEEISEILKIPMGSVKSKLSRAREKLALKLKNRLGEKNELPKLQKLNR
jgi:RNA polymerase sigma-70 factor, ECF subfamily